MASPLPASLSLLQTTELLRHPPFKHRDSGGGGNAHTGQGGQGGSLEEGARSRLPWDVKRDTEAQDQAGTAVMEA